MTEPANKVVLVLRDQSPVQVMLSRIKESDVWLHFPHLRTWPGVLHEELRRNWTKAEGDAYIHEHEDGHREWCVKGKPLTDREWNDLFDLR